MPEAYPLHWPDGQPRTPPEKREYGQFKVSPGIARDSLFEELRKMNARYAVVSTDVPLRRDGLPYAGRENPDDPGVAVYFEHQGEAFCFACDRYNKIHKNIRAIALTVSALRGIERWGSGEMMRRSFQGFKALPPPDDPWHVVLGVAPDAPREVIDAAYRALSKKHHPDAGGDPHEFARISQAREQSAARS